LLDGLASALLLPLPEWIATDDAADHWHGGHRGLIARRLIEQLSSRAQTEAQPETHPEKLSQRLRSRLGRE
jgi:flagellar basal body-associated protein FliL